MFEHHFFGVVKLMNKIILFLILDFNVIFKFECAKLVVPLYI